MIQGFVQIFLTLFLVVVSVPIVGYYLAEVFFMHKTWLVPVMNPLERLIYLLIDIEPQKSMTGREYVIAILLSKQGLSLLIQLVLEFAPVVAELVQKRSQDLALSKYEPIEVIPEILKVLNPSNKKSTYVEDFEQEIIFQQQLVADNHQTQLRIAAQGQ